MTRKKKRKMIKIPYIPQFKTKSENIAFTKGMRFAIDLQECTRKFFTPEILKALKHEEG